MSRIVVSGEAQQSDKYLSMLRVKYSCETAGINVPEEVTSYLKDNYNSDYSDKELQNLYFFSRERDGSIVITQNGAAKFAEQNNVLNLHFSISDE